MMNELRQIVPFVRYFDGFSPGFGLFDGGLISVRSVVDQRRVRGAERPKG